MSQIRIKAIIQETSQIILFGLFENRIQERKTDVSRIVAKKFGFQSNTFFETGSEIEHLGSPYGFEIVIEQLSKTDQ